MAEALAVSNGRITRVGSSRDVDATARPGVRRIDLGGRTLIPGFHDAHAHLWKLGQLATSVLDVRGVKSIDTLQASLRAFASRLEPGAWCIARGYNDAVLHEGRHPERRDLDVAVADRPVFLSRVCGHIAAVNSRALELAGVTASTDPPAGGRIDRDARGEPTGVLRETAMGLVSRSLPAPTEAEYEAMVRAGSRRQLQRGITSTSDCGVLPDVLSAYRALDERGELLQRVNVMPLRRRDGNSENLPLPHRHRSDRLRVDTVKLFADGGLSGATAALSEPYRDGASRGILRLGREELLDLVRESRYAGWRVGVHAIGDEAIERVLSVLEELPRGTGDRIEHLALPSADHLRRAARLGLVAIPQTVFLHSLGTNFRRHLPEGLLARVYPVRSMLEAGLTVALSSDAPVVEDDDPLLGIQAAILRRDREGHSIAPSETITAAEALYAYTMGGAIASGEAESRGSLSAGKWADLAVLSASPLVVPPAALTEIELDSTFVGGELAYER